MVTQPEPVKPRPATPPATPAEDPEQTWEEKEDKLDAENIEPKTVEQKYQYKEGKVWGFEPSHCRCRATVSHCHSTCCVMDFTTNYEFSARIL